MDLFFICRAMFQQRFWNLLIIQPLNNLYKGKLFDFMKHKCVFISVQYGCMSHLLWFFSGRKTNSVLERKGQKTDLPPATENLWHINRCNCKINCDSKRCTYRKHCLDCSVGCGECRWIACSNSPSLSEIEQLI